MSVQASYRVGSPRIGRDYAALARGASAESVPGLRKAEAAARAARRRTAALTPPPEARRLHRLVLGLLDRQVELAHETTLFAGYQPPLLAASAEQARERVAGLQPPRMLIAARADQESRLAALATLTRKIAATLATGDRAALAPLLDRYAHLVRDVQTPAQQAARAAAIRSYNARVHGLDVQAAKVEVERLRLERELNK